MATRKTASTVADIDFLEQRFTIDTLPTLEELASYRVVFAMWYNYVEGNSKDNPCRIVYRFDELVKSLEVPRTIEKLLKNCVVNVCKDLEDWKSSFDLSSANYNRTLDRRCWSPRNCFWLPNGKFDYKKTIRNVLFEGDLTEVEKFTILCQYCFEDDIKKFTLESLPSDFVESVNFNTNCLLYYWIRYLKNELHEIPLKSYNTVDFLMAATCNDKSLLAFRFFWDRLSETDQIALAVLKLRPDHYSRLRSYDIQERLLSMMSFHQQHCLLSQLADVIILNFFALHSPQSIFWAWQHSKELMTGEQFGNLVTTVFGWDVKPYSDNYEESLAILVEVWDTAPDHLKKHTSQCTNIDDKIVKSFNVTCGRASLPLDMYKFLYKFLLVKDVDNRKNFMLKNAIALEAIIFDPRVMNDVVNLCLPNPNDQLTYKQTILHSFRLKEDLANWFNFIGKCYEYEDIDLKIACYTKNEAETREYKKDYLLGFDKLDRTAFIFDPENWKTLTEYIDKSFPNPSDALEVKKGFVMAFVRFAGDYWETEDEFSEAFSREDLHYWNDVNSFDEFTLFVEKLFSEDELKTLKLTFLNSFERVITVGFYWSFFDENYYRKFVMWCVDYDEQAFAKFKKDRIRAKYIFNGILNTMSREYNHLDYKNRVEGEFDPDLLTKVDDVITWYFDGNTGKKTDYKKKRILNYDKKAWGVITMVDSMHGYGCDDDMDVFLKWAFEGDEQAVRKFKKDNGIFDDSSDDDEAVEDSDDDIVIDPDVALQRLIIEMRKYW